MKTEYYIKPPSSFRRVLKALEVPEAKDYRRFILSFWFLRPSKVKKHQGNKLDFLFLVLNNIAYDATIRRYNDVVVPTIDSCQPISMPKKKSILTISYDIS